VAARSRARRPAPQAGERSLTDEIRRLQRTAGNRATTRLLAVQRDARTPSGTAYDRVYAGYWQLMQDIMHVNAKVVSGIRADWTEDLGRGLAALGDPATVAPATIAALEQRLTATRGAVEAEVAAAKEEWASLRAEYRQERDRLAGGSGTDAEALRLLDLRFKDDENKVFLAYRFLTFDDVAGLQTMLANKTHVRWATHQDEVEYQQRRKAQLAKLPHFTSFRIRTLAGGAVSVGPVGAEVTTVELLEVGARGRTGMLTFTAEGLTLGFEAGAQGPQSWTDFTTSDPMRLEYFACPGRVTSVGGHVVYGATYSWLTFYPVAQRAVKIASSGHGWGFGGGLSTTAGVWFLRSTG
jgi:hypothetical protein